MYIYINAVHLNTGYHPEIQNPTDWTTTPLLHANEFDARAHQICESAIPRAARLHLFMNLLFDNFNKLIILGCGSDYFNYFQ